MISIRHNVREVRERFERFSAGVQRVPELSVSPDYWLPLAKREAQQILLVVAPRKYHYLISSFVETVTVIAFGTPKGATMVWTMEAVKEATIDARDLSKQERDSLWEKRGQFTTRDAVVQWVAEYKDKDKDRDVYMDGSPMSDEDIAERILAMMFGGTPEQEMGARSIMFGNSGSHSQKEDGTGYLIEHLLRSTGMTMNEDEIRDWLKAVLAAWKQLIKDELPRLMRRAIRQAWRESRA